MEDMSGPGMILYIWKVKNEEGITHLLRELVGQVWSYWTISSDFMGFLKWDRTFSCNL